VRKGKSGIPKRPAGTPQPPKMKELRIPIKKRTAENIIAMNNAVGVKVAELQEAQTNLQNHVLPILTERGMPDESVVVKVTASNVATGVGAVRKVLGHGDGGVPQVTMGGKPISISDINPNIPAPAGGGASSSPSGGGMDWLGLAEGGLAGLQAYNSAKASGRAGKYQDAALAQAQARYAEGAPLRAMGRARILNPQRPDLTSVYNDPTNAFSAPVTTAPALPRRRLLQTGG
jgi:hypothetical protein